MLKRDGLAAHQRKCKRITGDDNGYAKAMETEEQLHVCIENWIDSEEITAYHHHAKITQDYKPLIRQ